jgi:hypothetical protein
MLRAVGRRRKYVGHMKCRQMNRVMMQKRLHGVGDMDEPRYIFLVGMVQRVAFFFKLQVLKIVVRRFVTTVVLFFRDLAFIQNLPYFLYRQHLYGKNKEEYAGNQSTHEATK